MFRISRRVMLIATKDSASEENEVSLLNLEKYAKNLIVDEFVGQEAEVLKLNPPADFQVINPFCWLGSQWLLSVYLHRDEI